MNPGYTQQLSHSVTFEAFPWVDVSCTTGDASTFESWEAEMILSDTKRSHSLHEITLYSHNHQHRYHYYIGTSTRNSLNTRLDPSVAEFGRHRRKIWSRRKSAEKNSTSQKSAKIKKFGRRQIFFWLIFGGSANRNMHAKFWLLKPTHKPSFTS